MCSHGVGIWHASPLQRSRFKVDFDILPFLSLLCALQAMDTSSMQTFQRLGYRACRFAHCVTMAKTKS